MTASSATSELLQEAIFPPVPDTVERIREEMANGSPDLDRLTAIVSNDVGLSAAVLQTVNSRERWRTRPLSSIASAVVMLGVSKVFHLAVAIASRARIKTGGAITERHGEVAGDIAAGMAFLSRELSGLHDEMAYTFGLFHDIGVPILTLGFPDYHAVFNEAGTAAGRCLTEVERQRFGVSHAAVGGHVSKLWNLHPTITLAIRRHHHFEALRAPGAEVDDDVVTLVGLLQIAEQACNSYRGEELRSQADDREWERVGQQVLDYFSLSWEDYRDLKGRVVDAMGTR